MTPDTAEQRTLTIAGQSLGTALFIIVLMGIWIYRDHRVIDYYRTYTDDLESHITTIEYEHLRERNADLDRAEIDSRIIAELRLALDVAQAKGLPDPSTLPPESTTLPATPQ